MADVMPNYHVEKQRLVSQLANLRATIERQRLENMELEDRIARNNENIEATEKAVQESEAKLQGLRATYG